MHHPPRDEPLILVIVDELSTLTAYEPDTKLRNRATAAISALLARAGRPRVVVLAAAQDPRKEVVSFRSLFPTKIALRLDTPSQVDMVLGDGMHAMGALRPDPGRRPASATSPWKGSGNRSGSAPATSPTTTSRAQTTDFPAPTAAAAGRRWW